MAPMKDQDAAPSSAKAAMVTVGNEQAGKGRGFVVEARRRVHRPAGLAQHIKLVPFVTNRFVITAAHCSPHLPPAHPASFAHERSYLAMLGPLDAEPTIAAECLFVDPIADVAVLCGVDGQTTEEFFNESEAYEDFMDRCSALRVGIVTEPCEAWLLTRSGSWHQCGVRGVNRAGMSPLVLVDAQDGNAPGCSGSPIVTADGREVGIVSVGALTNDGVAREQIRATAAGNLGPARMAPR